MGSNNIHTVLDNTLSKSNDVNQYKTAITGNFVPRNISGIPQDSAGSLGEAETAWIRAYINSGYWTVGDIKAHHTYGGIAPIGQGWYPCDGSLINQTNYDAVHGEGSWEKYVIDSPLNNKYSPNLIDKFLIGKNATNQNGVNPITSIGSNSVDLGHSHAAQPHNHCWSYWSGYTFDSAGNPIQCLERESPITSNNGYALITYVMMNTLYTDKQTQSIGQSLGTLDKRPESIEVMYCIRII